MTSQPLFYAALSPDREHVDFMLHPKEQDFDHATTCLAEFWRNADNGNGLSGASDEFVLASNTVREALLSVWSQLDADLFGAVIPAYDFPIDSPFEISVCLCASTFSGDPWARTEDFLLKSTGAMREREVSIVEHLVQSQPRRCVKIMYPTGGLYIHRDGGARGCLSFNQTIGISALVVKSRP